MTFDNIMLRLTQVWDRPTASMDWLGLERTIRDILGETLKTCPTYTDELTLAHTKTLAEAIGMINEALAAYTGRGYVVIPEVLPGNGDD